LLGEENRFNNDSSIVEPQNKYARISYVIGSYRLLLTDSVTGQR